MPTKKRTCNNNYPSTFPDNRGKNHESELREIDLNDENALQQFVTDMTSLLIALVTKKDQQH
jgi:hypothetical protein